MTQHQASGRSRRLAYRGSTVINVSYDPAFQLSDYTEAAEGATGYQLGNHQPSIPMDSQAKHVALAAGAADLLIRFPPTDDFHDAIWDCAAGSLLVEEAGGRVTDLDGRALDFRTGRRLVANRGLAASNRRLHEDVLSAIRRVSSAK